MASAFNKEIIRSIKGSAGRFAAILVISLLGAGFYAGLRMAAPDMRIDGDAFFDATNLYDVSVVSTLGLDADSVAALAGIEGVDGVMATHKADVMLVAGDNSYAASVESFPVDSAQASDTSDGVHAVSDDRNYLNRLVLLEGDWPQAAAECVVGADAAHELGIKVGDAVHLAEKRAGGDDDQATFALSDLRVAGLVNSPAYASASTLGATSLGTGEVELYAYVPDAVFDADLPFSVAYLALDEAHGRLWDSAAYDEVVGKAKALVESAAPAIGQARYDAVVQDAQDELDDARADYLKERADAEADLADARKELDDAKADLDDGKADLDDAQAQIESNRADLADAREGLDEAFRKLADSQKKLDETRGQLDAAYEELSRTYEQISQMEQGIAAGAITDPVQVASYEQGLAAYEKAKAEYERGLAAYEAGVAEYERGLAEYTAGKERYEQGVRQFNEGVHDYEEGREDYEQGLAEYEDGEREYADGVAEAAEKFADAESELADAQADIDDIEHPEVYVLDRAKNAGTASLSSDAEGITQIALFLPFMFFLVAALVSLTSMTRMVEEERLEIGTHKALGYGKARITSKYLIYGALASGAGSALGVVSLGKLLPWFILVSYGVTYAIPVYATPIDAGVALRAVGLSVGITLAATWWAAASTLRDKPAALMLPRVPKAGKRIVLERIGPLWRRMTFSQKVTARNLLRYKRRFLMAVLGVAGCTALLMIGFGLRDAIGGIVEAQYGELVAYDAAVRFDDDIQGAQRKRVVEALQSDDAVSDWLLVSDFNLIAEGPDDDLRIEVVVPSDASRLTDFVNLRERGSGDALAPNGERIVITEKAADVLGVAVGDELRLFDEDGVGDKQGSGRSFVVGGVAENYLGHFAYVLPEGYERAFGERPAYDMAYVTLDDTAGQGGDGADGGRAALSEQLLSLEGVSTVSFVSDKIVTYEGMLDVMNKLIYVIMLLSAALAFVVLYNLTNINIAERVREIATLKVLGFTRGEVNAYIFREVMVMAVLGALLGCVIGVPLTFYIARAAETANMMFGRTIEPASFALSFVLTMAFAGIVAFAMRGKLVRVNMVESLKSVE